MSNPFLKFKNPYFKILLNGRMVGRMPGSADGRTQINMPHSTFFHSWGHKKPTKYFCGLEHHSFITKTLNEFELDNGTFIMQRTHYSVQYTSNIKFVCQK